MARLDGLSGPGADWGIRPHAGGRSWAELVELVSLPELSVSEPRSCLGKTNFVVVNSAPQ